MCYRSTTCPMYVKRFERTARWSRIGLIGAMIAFVITTYLIY